jgi:hypothetical protein
VATDWTTFEFRVRDLRDAKAWPAADQTDGA